MRLDGGHPALDLVNTVYGQPGEPPEHDVLATPSDLATFARRVELGGEATSAGALRAARALRAALDAILASRVAGAEPPPAARAVLADAARAAFAAGRLDRALTWSWEAGDAHAPVHRLALAALDLLADEAELARLHRCAGCCWFFLDHSRGAGRRWCSMADCGTEAKKRRYVQRRRERRG
jgi:predicted RNA-binding Zn ribbon-like protein